MELTFDYYKNAQDAEIYLCNPDKSLLGALYAKNKNVILRFNSISELTFEVPKYVSNSAGEMIEHPYYERIATKRLVKVDKIGWFRIIQAVETENATGAVKAVTAESHQAVFKDMGFVEENRLYKFYDATDIYDENYDPDDAGAIPSVVGQLYQQLGITCDLNIGDITPTIDYEKWKIIWIEEALRYSPAKTENVCRTLKGGDGLFGYDFMVSNVEDAFQVIFEFDFLHHAIKIKSAASVAAKANIYLSFENLVQELALTEKSDEIVTVLSCKGTDLDITSVNPMGTNYICDFSYFMGDETNGYPWMSKALTDKLIEWKANVDASESTYSDYVAQLQDLYLEKTEYESKKTFVDLKLKDMEEVRDQYINNQSLATSYFGAETVETGEKSRERNSVFYSAGFSKDSTARAWKCYAVPPVYNADTNSYAFEGDDFKSGTTLANCFAQDQTYLYFMDGDTKSYCKIKQGMSVEDENATYFVDGFERFTAYKNNGHWYDLYAAENQYIDNNITRIMGNETTPNTINYVLAKMSEIAEQTNILTYFAAYPTLFDELKCYWVDGQYTNDTLKAVDGTTVAENLELAKELMDAGKTELNRVCQPRFSFTVTSANFLKMPQFLKFAREIALGKVVTVEKNENTHYFPALTEMAFSLDTSENFSLTFSNSLKLTDWGYTYADLIKSASSTTRTVESNWSNLMDYSQSKEQINQMLYNTLDRTLRAGMDNAYAQDFVIDNSGILGRKKREDGTFEDCQVRMTNNLLVFTRDNWQTACTALGQIYYDNPDGTVSEGYGLVADVLVGNLMLSRQMVITNGDDDNSILLNDTGILIKHEGENVFVADISGNLEITGIIHATGGEIGALTINEDGSIVANYFSLLADGTISATKGNIGVLNIGEDGTVYTEGEKFMVNTEGILTAQDADIEGVITAKSGWISDLQIDNGIKGYIDGEQTFSLSSDGLFMANSNAKIQVGNFETYYDSQTNNTYWQTNGALYIRGMINGSPITSIELMTDGGTSPISPTIGFSVLKTVDEDGGKTVSLSVRLTTTQKLYYPVSYTIYYATGQARNIGSAAIRSHTLTLYPGQDYSTMERYFSVTGWTLGLGVSYIRFGLTREAVSSSENHQMSSYSSSSWTNILTAGTITQTQTNNNIKITGNIIPKNKNTYTLGNTDNAWAAVYAQTAEILSSDANKKNTIDKIIPQYEDFFDLLNPVTFKYNENTSDRKHLGFIAQDVKNALDLSGVKSKDFAGYCEWICRDGSIGYGLRYEEFIALNTWEIQKLKSRVSELEKQIKELKEIKGNET